MSEQHTPGEWQAEPAEAPTKWGNGWMIESDDGYAIGFVPNNNREPQNEANARLIASAPELLAALEQIIANAKPRQGVQAGSEAFMIFLVKGADIEAARAAIAKAQGE